MADSILAVLQQFLCYGSQSCVQEFNQYAYKPMEGIFYAVFFPIVVILLFVYIVSGAVGSLRHRGFRILIGVAFFAFIILQGWYYFFILISKMWFVVLFLLGILWFAIHTFTGREGGGGGGHARTIGGAMAGLSSARLMRKITGAEKREADAIRAMIDALEGTSASHDTGKLIDEITHDLRTFAESTSANGLAVFSEAPALYRKFSDACKRKKQAVPQELTEAMKRAEQEYKIRKN